MIGGYRMALGALVCTTVIMISFDAFADNATDAKSSEEIGRQLKPRGLPMGSLPWALHRLNPARVSLQMRKRSHWSRVRPNLGVCRLLPGRHSPPRFRARA